MANPPVARRYAQALFELGVEGDELDALGAALNEASELFKKSDELQSVLINPAITTEERRNIIDALAKKADWPKLFRNFMMLLLDKDRLRFVSPMADAFSTMMDEHQGRARARVTTAVAMGDEQVEQIRERLSALTGKDVVVTTEVDEELIGGVVARVGSTIYDGSVRTHLQRMREAILKEV